MPEWNYPTVIVLVFFKRNYVKFWFGFRISLLNGVIRVGKKNINLNKVRRLDT